MIIYGASEGISEELLPFCVFFFLHLLAPVAVWLPIPTSSPWLFGFGKPVGEKRRFAGLLVSKQSRCCAGSFKAAAWDFWPRLELLAISVRCAWSPSSKASGWASIALSDEAIVAAPSAARTFDRFPIGSHNPSVDGPCWHPFCLAHLHRPSPTRSLLLASCDFRSTNLLYRLLSELLPGRSMA